MIGNQPRFEERRAGSPSWPLDRDEEDPRNLDSPEMATPLRRFRSAAIAIWAQLVDEAPAVMTTGVGASVAWIVVGHYRSPWSIAFLAVAGLGIVLWVVRSRRRRRENPKGWTIVDAVKRLDRIEMYVKRGTKPPEPAGDTITLPAGATLSTAIGVGPLVITLPPGPQMITVPVEATATVLPLEPHQEGAG
jgi:hypothetical protein